MRRAVYILWIDGREKMARRGYSPREVKEIMTRWRPYKG